jgi:membrane-associated phospholipid phosphatase
LLRRSKIHFKVSHTPIIGHELAKDIIARPRPVIPASDFLISADKDYAFPSGHAVIVSAGATGALMLIRRTPRRLVVSTILAIEAAIVCLSRIYVGPIILWM